METAERLQRQIGTLDELHSIVRTMKALSAVSIQQYENSAESLDSYSRNVDLGLHAILREMPPGNVPSDSRQGTPQCAAIIFGADHGLCGSFNDDIARYALENWLGRTGSQSSPPQVVVVGDRVASILTQAEVVLAGNYPVPSSADGISNTVQELLLKIDEWRSATDILNVHIFFNRRRNDSSSAAGGYQSSMLQLLPVDLNRFRQLENSPWPSRHLPSYSMQRTALISALLRQYFFVTLFRACAESQASEHSSRLNTMRAAEKNLQERLDEVKTQFRRVRQEAITTELLDLVSGFEVTVNDRNG